MFFRYKNFRLLNTPHVSMEQVLGVLKTLDFFTYIPNSGNMGDMFIAYATIHWFKKNHLNYGMYRDGITDTVVYGGGGQWVDLYKKHWLKWLDVFKKAKRIVILPSSFHNCPELIDALDERFTVFCREKQSYDYLISANTKATVLLAHDMSLTLKYFNLRERTETVYVDTKKIINEKIKPNKVLFLCRTDEESKGNYKTDLDLSYLLFGDEYLTRHYAKICTQLIFETVDMADIIVTDRLHVCIAASMMNKEVYLLDNSYGKNSNVYKHSLKSNRKIHLCSTIPEKIIKTYNNNKVQ